MPADHDRERTRVHGCCGLLLGLLTCVVCAGEEHTTNGEAQSGLPRGLLEYLADWHDDNGEPIEPEWLNNTELPSLQVMPDEP